MGFHHANFGFLGLSVLELNGGTRQTHGQRDTGHHFIMPSLYGLRKSGHKNSHIYHSKWHCVSFMSTKHRIRLLQRGIKPKVRGHTTLRFPWQKFLGDSSPVIYATVPLAYGLAECKARFQLPELTARVNGPSWQVTGFHYPSTRAVNSGRQLG